MSKLCGIRREERFVGGNGEFLKKISVRSGIPGLFIGHLRKR
jgi:hypothetical protein